jgi:hypothetical protein
MTVLRAIDNRYFAESAIKGASPGGHERHERYEVFFPVKEFPAGERKVLQVMEPVRLVAPLHSTGPEIIEQFRPAVFRLSYHNRIAVLKALFRQKRGVEPSHDDRNAASAESIGYSVGTFCRGDGGGNADQAVPLAIVDLHEPVIQKLHFRPFRREPCQIRERQAHYPSILCLMRGPIL